MLRKLVAVSGLTVAVSLGATVVTAAPALAKGATKAIIAGPGLARPIVVADAGEPGQSGSLATLAEQSGLFTVLFGSGMSGSETTRRIPPPQTTLGPRYTLVYTVPGVDPQPGQRYGRIRQTLYPYAAGGPLTYTPRGQHGFTPQLPATGWLRADAGLVRTLTKLGVPTESTTAPVRPIAGSGIAGTGPRASVGLAIAWSIVAIVVGAALILAGRKTRRPARSSAESRRPAMGMVHRINHPRA